MDTLHLEKAVEITDHYVDRHADWSIHSEAARKRREMAAAMAARTDDGDGPSSVGSLDGESPLTSVYDLARRFPDAPLSACEALADMDPNCLNVDLVADVVLWHLSGAHAASEYVGSDGAVLVFLPGVGEIEDVKRVLLESSLVRADALQAEWILPLHGSLPPDEQRRVFERPPEGTTKVVLATNVAETSITIDDVTFVVDSGRAKLLSHDPTTRIASLDDVLISAAAAKQRRGRAGRVRPGLCVHLYPSDEHLDKYTEPEVRRVPLEQLLMRIKSLRLPGSAASIAAQLPEPPDPAAVLASIRELETLGALDPDENLTPLGALLATLPIAPRLGKLIVYGSCFGAVDEALTIAAGLTSRSPFMSPLDLRQEADWSKTDFAAGSQSDYLAIMHAYADYDALDAPERFHFARQRFLGIRTLQGVASLKRQLLEVLSTADLAPRGMRASWVESLGRRNNDPTDGVALALHIAADRGEHPRPTRPSELLLTGLLCAALYPQLSYLHAPPTKKGKPAPASTIRLHMRDASGVAELPTEGVVHPASVNSNLNGADWHSAYVAYHDVCFTSKLYVRGSTPVPPLVPFIFCGQEIAITPCGAGEAWRIVTLDGWLRIKLDAQVAPLLLTLRHEIDQLLQKMVERAATGGRRPTGRSASRWGAAAREPSSQMDDDEETAMLGDLCRSIDALLSDAIVEPLPPMPKPSKAKAKAGGGSRKTKKRRAWRKRKAQQSVEAHA